VYFSPFKEGAAHHNRTLVKIIVSVHLVFVSSITSCPRPRLPLPTRIVLHRIVFREKEKIEEERVGSEIHPSIPPSQGIYKHDTHLNHGIMGG
jgi:hypothetical protein